MPSVPKVPPAGDHVFWSMRKNSHSNNSRVEYKESEFCNSNLENVRASSSSKSVLTSDDFSVAD